MLGSKLPSDACSKYETNLDPTTNKKNIVSMAILTIFFLLVVGSRFVSYFEQASEGNLDPSIIFYAVFLRFPDFISLLIPLSFFLGILITVSRLYADREIYAYFSTGICQ